MWCQDPHPQGVDPQMGKRIKVQRFFQYERSETYIELPSLGSCTRKIVSQTHGLEEQSLEAGTAGGLWETETMLLKTNANFYVCLFVLLYSFHI